MNLVPDLPELPMRSQALVEEKGANQKCQDKNGYKDPKYLSYEQRDEKLHHRIIVEMFSIVAVGEDHEPNAPLWIRCDVSLPTSVSSPML